MIYLSSRLRVYLAALCVLVLGTAAAAASPSKQDVLQAISVIERKVLSPEAAEAAKTVVLYAQVSDDVMVDIGPEQLPWIDEPWGLGKEREQTCKSLLLAAFVAGNVKSQIQSEKAEDDTYSGWLLAIDTYQRLRAKAPFRSPSLDALAQLKSEGKLLDHAKEVRMKEEREEQADQPHRPLALGQRAGAAPGLG